MIAAGHPRPLWSPGRRPPAAPARMAPRHQAQFFRQLAMLLSAGFLLTESLGRLKQTYPDSRTRRLIGDIHVRVAGSRTSLSQALALLPSSFSATTVAVVQAGEEAGSARLAERLTDLACRLDYADANRRQLRRACAYPALVLGMASGLCVFLLGVVFPRLEGLLSLLGGGLPPLTRAVMASSRMVRCDWPAALAVAGFGAAAVLLLRRIPAWSRALDRLLLVLPFFGPTYRELTGSLICRIYRQLYQAGKPVPEILHLCSQLPGNAEVRARLKEARRRITAGGSTVAEALAGSGLLTPLGRLAVEVGEQSGQLAEALDRTALTLDASARARIAAAMAVINPSLVLLVVAGVGLVVLSFFQALYQVVYVTR